MATTKGRHVYTEVSYEPDCYIMFGKSAGIPEEILKANPDTCADSDDRRDAVAQFIQFGCNCAV